MKKQNTLEFLVKRLDNWPTRLGGAPLIFGYTWTKSLGEIILFDNEAMKCESMQQMTIELHDWKVACLDSATERAVVEAKQDAMAKSLIDGIKSGDIDIQPLVDAINKESGFITVNTSTGKLTSHESTFIAEKAKRKFIVEFDRSIERAVEQSKESTVKINNFDMNTKHTPDVKLTSHEKAVIAGAWDTNKNIADIERRKDITGIKPNDQVKNPSHYQIIEGFESITIIASALTTEQWKGFCIGNTLKYRIRAGKKGDLKQDIDKADFYEELYEQHKHLCKV
mgnify:CR=1 FL=1